jgi:hypothetical protein
MNAASFPVEVDAEVAGAGFVAHAMTTHAAKEARMVVGAFIRRSVA